MEVDGKRVYQGVEGCQESRNVKQGIRNQVFKVYLVLELRMKKSIQK